MLAVHGLNYNTFINFNDMISVAIFIVMKTEAVIFVLSFKSAAKMSISLSVNEINFHVYATDTIIQKSLGGYRQRPV